MTKESVTLAFNRTALDFLTGIPLGAREAPSRSETRSGADVRRAPSSIDAGSVPDSVSPAKAMPIVASVSEHSVSSVGKRTSFEAGLSKQGSLVEDGLSFSKSPLSPFPLRFDELAVRPALVSLESIALQAGVAQDARGRRTSVLGGYSSFNLDFTVQGVLVCRSGFFPYEPAYKVAARNRQRLMSPVDEVPESRSKQKPISYSDLLDSTNSHAPADQEDASVDRENEEKGNDTFKSTSGKYDPSFLADDFGETGQRKTVLNFRSFSSSISPFVKPSVLRAELNEQFRLRHKGWLQDSSLTLSKIRKMKLLLYQIAREKDLDIATLALSYVYLEKLILKNLVKKKNRKRIAGTCLLIAIKFNDRLPRSTDPTYSSIKKAFSEVFEEHLSLSWKEVITEEWSTYVALEFSINYGLDECQFHIRSICSLHSDEVRK